MLTLLALLLAASPLKGENLSDGPFTLAWTAVQACANSGARFERAAERLTADGWTSAERRWVKSDKGPAISVELAEITGAHAPNATMCTVSSPDVEPKRALKAFVNLVGKANYKGDTGDRSANWRVRINDHPYFASVRPNLSGGIGSSISLISIPKVEEVK